MNPQESLDAQWLQAETHLARKSLAAAEAVARKMVAVAPLDARGHVMLARAVAALTGPADGERTLLAAPAHLLDGPLAMAWRARLAWEAGNTARAEELAARMASDVEPPVALRWTRARLAHARGDWEKACADLVVLTRTTPEDRDSWRLLAACLVASGKPQVAVMALEYVLPQEKTHAPTWRALVQAQLGAGNVAQSFATVQEGLKMHPRDAGLLALSTQLRALNTTTGSDVQARILEAQVCLDAGRVEEAARVLAELQKQHPSSRSLGFLAQEVALAQTADAGVVRLLPDASKAVSSHAGLLEPKLILLSILLRPSSVRNVAQALSLAEQAWAMAPGHPHVGFLLVRCLVLTGRKSHARALAPQLELRSPALHAPLLALTGD